MRVGISSLMIQRGKTGVAQYLFGLLHGLQQRVGDQHFTVFVLQDDLPLFASFQSSMRLVAVPESYREPAKNIRWHHQYLPRLVREHRLDVLHIPSYRRLLWRRPCPLVATIHDLAPFHVPHKYDWKRMFYGRVVVRWLAWRQDRIIAVSQNTANDLARFFRLPPNRIQVIHNGLDHQRFSPGRPERSKQWVKKRFGLEAPFFLYVARLEHPAKNHLRLISAFEQFRTQCHSPWQLVLGGSDWHGAEAIHTAINCSPQRQQIRSLGFVPDQELPELYRAADAFIYPSLYEGFGLPPIEAMACGCPVISSTRGSLAEVIGNAALTVDPENVSDIAEKLIALTTGVRCSEDLRSAGLAQAKKFDWMRTAFETVRVYEQVASHIRSPQARLDSAPKVLGAAP
jgi:glycosyltransferase involved in cell wall biosynthesis